MPVSNICISLVQLERHCRLQQTFCDIPNIIREGLRERGTNHHETRRTVLAIHDCTL